MRVLAIALKDLLQVARDRKSALFLVLMPILFTLFFGFAFRASNPDPRLPVGWLDEDQGSLSAGLYRLLAASDAVRLVTLTPADAGDVDAQVRDGKLSAALLLPPRFTERTLAGETVPLTLIAPSSPAGQTASTAVQSASKRLLGSLQSARLATQAMEQQRPFADTGERGAFLEKSLAVADEAWQRPDLSVSTQEAGVPSTTPQIASGFAQSSPGMLVQFAVFGLLTSAMVLTLERKAGALQRMLTTPVSRAQVIAGHMLAMFALVFMQELLLVLLGQFAFGLNYLRVPLATLLMMVVLALWAASLGLLIGVIARKEEQVVVYTLVAMFLFSALGGAWFPLAIAGKGFSTVGHAMPTAWALDGFQNIIVRGQGLSAVLLPATVVLAYAAGFFALALWRFKFE
jgi:ABC-2 type transport system permease protein